MSDPVTFALVASTVISAGAAIQQGRAAKQAADFTQQQLEEEQVRSDISTLDESIKRRREIAQVLGEQEAQGAAKGFDPFSSGSSFLAIREDTERVGREDVDMIRLVGSNLRAKFGMQGEQAGIAGRAAQTAGFLKAAGTLAQGGIQQGQLKASGAIV
jgi:hypothetical protein